MTKQTRYFLLGSATTLLLGLAVGVFAYYGGLSGIASMQSTGVARDLEYVPADATVVAYANVREVMTSEMRQRVKRFEPEGDKGKKEFEDKTGVDIDSDIDRVLACVTPDASGNSSPEGGGFVLARGRFNQVKIEGLVREQGGRAEQYNGIQLLVYEPGKQKKDRFALAFVEPGLLAMGSSGGVRKAIDSKRGGKSIRSKPEVMKQIEAIDEGNVWAVGRFDVLTEQAHLPREMAGKLPPINMFSASGRVNGGVSGTITAQASDEQAANNLRDVVRGMLALARLQSGGNPQVQNLLQSLQMGGSGTSVSISFTIPVELLDAFAPKKGRAVVQP
ncbi:MAG: hypothetical protein HYZ58_11590 [Acidobacteria bacterium]|nr:hypothetical protein [Acidobacteriota bacterium]MBI3263776.1 hypothetical protein [Acidobacteriota bacterium]